MRKQTKFNCMKCGKVIDYHPIRLTKKFHDEKETYGAYHTDRNIDLCDECFAIFERWIEGGNKNAKSRSKVVRSNA